MEDNSVLILKQQFDAYKEYADKEIHELKLAITEQDKRIKEMELSKQKTEYQYEQIMKSLQILNEKTIPNLSSQIEELKNKPVKRYDQVVTGLLGAIVGAIGAVIARLFIK